jgi:predicted alpha/beta superfamily hydrolase
VFNKILVVAAVLLGTQAIVYAAPVADRPYVVNNSHILSIHSKATGKDHELIVILPASYATHPEKTYPVLYFCDAQWDAPLVSATYGNLNYDNHVPEFIMVGLSYRANANYGTERRGDYTPTSIDPISGKGAKFLEYVTKEVAPLIEKRYRAAKTERVLAGNSLGGLFTIYAAYAAPGFFEGFVAISPAAGWDDNYLSKLDDEFAKSGKALSGRMFVSYGTAEYAPFREPILAFQNHLAARNYPNLALQNYVMEGIDHSSSKGEGYVRGLSWVWKAKKPAGPSGLEREMTASK